MTPELLLPVAAVVAVLVALFVLRARRRAGKDDDGPWPFQPRRLLSQPEQVLYHRLVAALPDRIVLAQVQASRVLAVKKGSDFHRWNNRINRLSYDFVVCGRDATVEAVIELDDASHDAPERAEVDRRKDRATAAAGLRMIRWHVRSLPDEAMIRRELAGGRPAAAAAPPRGAGPKARA